jgi:hypothetical protein
VTPPGSGGTAMPSRWQIDVLVYEDQNLYPVLLLQPGRHDDHRQLVRLLSRAGFATPTGWEWERGLWPWAAGCHVEITDRPAVTVHAGGRTLTVGFEPANPPLEWACAAHRQRQVLFVLLPPQPGTGEDNLIVDDLGTLGRNMGRRTCLAASIPFG